MPRRGRPDCYPLSRCVASFPSFWPGPALGSLAQAGGAVTAQTARSRGRLRRVRFLPLRRPAGHATIGYGHLLHYGPPTRADRRKWGCLTQAQAPVAAPGPERNRKSRSLTDPGAKVNAPMVTALTFAFNPGAGYLTSWRSWGSRPATNTVARSGLASTWQGAADALLRRRHRRRQTVRARGPSDQEAKEYRLMIRGIHQLRACDGARSDGPDGGLGVN